MGKIQVATRCKSFEQMRGLWLLFCLGVSTISLAQERVIQGAVVDRNTREPLVGANVFLKSDWKVGTSADTEGKFALTLQKTILTDSLVITYIGYYDQVVLISDFSDTPSVVALVPIELNLQEVVVEGESLVAEEFSFQKVNRLEIYTNPSAKADPLLAVNSLPAATTLDESANISFRGSGPSETGIFLNNVPIYDAVRFSQLNGIGTFSIFNTALVDNLQVFPGNPPLEFGNTTSGLISIQTAETVPEVAQNIFTASLASFGIQTNRKIGKDLGLNVFSNYQPSALLMGLNHEALADLEFFRSNDLGLALTKKFKDGALKIFNYILSERYDVNFNNPTFNGLFVQKKARNFTVSNFRKRLRKSEVTLNHGLSFSRANFGFSASDMTVKNFDHYFSGNYQHFGERNVFKAGITSDYRRQDFDGRFYRYDYAIGPGYPLDSATSRTESLVNEIYFYNKFIFRGNLILGGGLRKNIPASEQQGYWSAQMNLNYHFSDKTSITLGVGQYHKYGFNQNDSSEPELIKSNQASADLKTLGNANDEFTLSLFVKRSEIGGTMIAHQGVELYGRKKLSRRLDAQLSFTYLNGRVEEESETYGSQYDLDYFVRGSLAYQHNLWTLTTTFLFRQGSSYQPLTDVVYREELGVFEPVFADNTDRDRLPGYNLIDLSISKLLPISESLSMIFFGAVNNIFDFGNVRTFSYNFDYTQRTNELFSQRTAYVGVVVNF